MGSWNSCAVTVGSTSKTGTGSPWVRNAPAKRVPSPRSSPPPAYKRANAVNNASSSSCRIQRMWPLAPPSVRQTRARRGYVDFSRSGASTRSPASCSAAWQDRWSVPPGSHQSVLLDHCTRASARVHQLAQLGLGAVGNGCSQRLPWIEAVCNQAGCHLHLCGVRAAVLPLESNERGRGVSPSVSRTIAAVAPNRTVTGRLG